MIYPDKDKQLVFDQKGAKGYKLADTAFNELVKLELELGAEILEHALPMHVTFYVIKGEGIALVNGTASLCKQGDVVVVAKNEQRGWKNESDNLLELLVVKQNKH